MDNARLSRYPHLSWLGFNVASVAAANPLVVHTHGACHTLSLTARGQHHVRWITRGRELRWSEHSGTVHFVPADGEHHTFLAAMSGDFLSNVLLLPRRHLEISLAAEECDAPAGLPRMLLQADAVLQTCIKQLFTMGRNTDGESDGWRDESARRMVLRLHELAGGRAPDWCEDESTFTRRTLAGLVEYIDAHLKSSPTLTDMSVLVGLSPSHFARKWRASTGLSLHRFINRRRLLAALTMLQEQPPPLVAVASELGFASQNHFTRLFSLLTGMTPAKYRKQFRPTVG